jgi:inosine/xanthosine triphosphate pyrophosphatase family protein
MSAALRVLLATTNPAKAQRLAWLCAGLAVEPVRPSGGDGPQVAEDAASHLGNAVHKAVAWSATLGGVALASDGGLVVPALAGEWDSLTTRRATGTGPEPDAERAERLLRRMARLTDEERAAHWVEAVAIARDGRLVGAWQAQGLAGVIAGTYAPGPDGEDGFWVSGLWAEGVSGQRLWELDEPTRSRLADPWLTLAPPARDLLTRMAG